MRRILCILLFSISLFQAWAQPNADCDLILSGKVIDEHDQSALSFATVYLMELQKGVVADEAGNYLVGNLCSGTYTIVVRHVSCQPDTLSMSLTKSTQQTLFLEHHSDALKDVVVTGQELQTSTNSDLEKSLDLGTIESFSGKSLGDALKTIPGVSVLKTGSTILKPVVQGMFGSRIITVNHGVRMQDMEWGDEHASTLDINTAGEITVIKGGSALRYGGDAVGGVIVIDAGEITPDTLVGRTIIHGATNGWGGSVTSELTKSGKTGWFGKVQGTLKRFGDFKAPDYQLTNTGFFEKGVSVTAGRQRTNESFELFYSLFDTDLAILAASHIGSVGDLVDAINRGDPLIVEDFSYEIGLPRQEITHQILKAQYHRSLKFGEIRFQYDFQHNHRFEFDRRVGDDRDKPAIDLELTTHSMTGNLIMNPTSKLLLETGLLYRYQNNFANPETGIRRLIPDYDRYETGVFLNGVYQWSNNLTLDVGIRYDFSRIDAKKFYQKSRWEERGYQEDFGDIIIREFPTQLLTNPVFDYNNISYAMGINYLLNSQTELRFNYSFHQRAPNPAELFSDGLHHGAARIELGDLRITQEQGHKLGVSASGHSGIWAWDISPYVNFLDGFIYLEPTGVEQTIRGAFPVWEYRQADARIWGVDAQAQAEWSPRWQTLHSISYTNGENIGLDEPLNNIPAPDLGNSITFRHQPWNNLQITLESLYNFEQKRFPDQNYLVFIPDTDTFEEVDISTPPDSYHLLNLNASFETVIFNKQVVNVKVGVNNLLNTNYRDYLNRLRYFADELGRSFEITARFNY